MKIEFLGTHNAEYKGSRLVSFLVDEIIGIEAGSLTSELTIDQQNKLQAILLSHAHYDHIRSIPALAFNYSNNSAMHLVNIIGISETLQVLHSHLMDGLIYPDFSSNDSYLEKPIINLMPVKPYCSTNIYGYNITAFPVNHPVDAVGYGIICPDNVCLFYSGDTGSGLYHIWEHVSPQFLIIDSTFPNRLKKIAISSGHMCPELIKNELVQFKSLKGYFPDVIMVHLSPEYESEIKTEAKILEKELKIKFEVPSEGDILVL